MTYAKLKKIVNDIKIIQTKDYWEHERTVHLNIAQLSLDLLKNADKIKFDNKTPDEPFIYMEWNFKGVSVLAGIHKGWDDDLVPDVAKAYLKNNKDIPMSFWEV